MENRCAIALGRVVLKLGEDKEIMSDMWLIQTPPPADVHYFLKPIWADEHNPVLTVPWHGQYGPLLMVVTVTLVDVLLEHSEDSHHADSLLTGTVNAIFISV